jgi:hypothetical protein
MFFVRLLGHRIGFAAFNFVTLYHISVNEHLVFHVF